MKTMHYLFLMGLLIFSSSCTNYGPYDNNGSEEESEVFHLELDFYQESLAYEDRLLSSEMLIIIEEIESGNNEQQGRLEEIQDRRSQIERNVAWNENIMAGIPIGPGGTPPRCDPGGREFKPCPMPKSALDNLYLATEQWQKSGGKIEIFNVKGQLVGRMNGMSEVPDSEGTLLKADIEFDDESAFEVRVTNLDVREELRILRYQLE